MSTYCNCNSANRGLHKNLRESGLVEWVGITVDYDATDPALAELKRGGQLAAPIAFGYALGKSDGSCFAGGMSGNLRPFITSAIRP